MKFPFQIHIHSFISFKLHYFQIHFPISISEKSVFSRISKSFSGSDFLRILSFQMTFQSISQVQIKIFQCFKILKFQNPKFSEIDFLRFPIFLRIPFSIFHFKNHFPMNFLIFSEFSNPFSQKSNSKSQNRFSKVQVFLRIHFPMQISDFQWNSMIFPGIQFSSTFPIIFKHISIFQSKHHIFSNLHYFQNFIAQAWFFVHSRKNRA